MSKWLSKYKNSPETPIRQTDKTDTAHIINFAAESKKVMARLRRNGAARIRSDALQDDILFAVDEAAAAGAKQVEPGATVYTLEELRELIRGDKTTREGLRQLHAAKQIFNGTIVKDTQRW